MSGKISRVRFKNVTRPEELLKVINIRHRKLVRELKRIKPGQAHDPYDGIGYNFMAYYEDYPEGLIGALRVVDCKDLEHLDGRKGDLWIRNFDMSIYRGSRNLLVGRMLTSRSRERAAVLFGLFACVYVYSYAKKITDLFIVANCEMNPGKVEIPKIYTRLGFNPIGEIRKRYYDHFDTHSVPMHRITGDIFGKSRCSPERKKFERFLERIDFRYIPPEERKCIYKEAVRQLRHSQFGPSRISLRKKLNRL